MIRMKKLIAVTVSGLMLGFTTMTVADTQVFGVNTPVESGRGVSYRVNGGHVESDHTSFYTTEKGLNKVDYSGEYSEDVSDSFIVFGVRVLSSSRI